MELRQSAYPVAPAVGTLSCLVCGVKGLASLGPFLGAIAWTCSASPSVLAVMFGVLVLLGSTSASTETSWTFLRAHVSSSHCSVLCAAVGYQVGISGEMTSYPSVFIALPGSCWIDVASVHGGVRRLPRFPA